ncbi:MAG: hypothetical protein JO005_11635 [Gammaproteobacteria bacterium]|nr:hypothetical protein [Gammaproteobacteria bacterium]
MSVRPAVALPDLDYAGWQGTLQTLHLWTQIVGKIRLALTPWVNHSWQVPLYVSARGLTTSAIPWDEASFELEFDFVRERLCLSTSHGEEAELALRSRPIAEFYAQLLAALRGLGIEVRIHGRPNEMPDPVPFAQDRREAPYDAAAAVRFWRALVWADEVLKHFRSGFLGKVSPVHFFWGSFDLAVTRFSGRRAPLHPGGVPGLPDAVAREAYSHELSSAGFWPGDARFPQAAFYSYAYPAADAFREQPVPAGARYEAALGEFVLPYEAVRGAAAPRELLLEFLERTYVAAADTGHWDRAALECERGAPGRVRPVSDPAASP